MKHGISIAFTIVTFSLLQAPAAHAALMYGQDIIAAPASVADDTPGAENFHQQAFDEQQGVLLASDLQVDGGFISSGTRVDSHMIFLNSPGNQFISDLGVKWTFDGTILGVMSDARGLLETASNSILGASGTTYPGAFSARGMEGGDSYSYSGNSIVVSMLVSEPGDWIRVVTATQIPEPMSAGLLLLGLAGLRRRLRA